MGCKEEIEYKEVEVMDNKEKIMELLESIDTAIVSPFTNNEELINTIHQLTDGVRIELNKPQNTNEGKQEFQLGDTAYMIDEDYRYFESMVNRIDLDEGGCFYTTNDADFSYKDIGDWVFTSELYRQIHMENMFGNEEYKNGRD